MRWGQQRQRNAVNNNSSTMLAMTQVQCRQNASTTPANASAVLAGPSKANSATMPAQRQQQEQLDAGNDASAMQARTPEQRKKKCHCCLGQTIEGQIALGRQPGTATRPQATTMSATMTPHRQRVTTASWLARCQFVMLAATRVCQRQGRQHDKGNNAGATLAMTMPRCWQWRQRVLRLLRDGADASLQCWRQRKGNGGNNASATRAKASTQQGQWWRRNAGNKDNSTKLAMMPVQCRQNASATLANTSAALAGPSKVNSAAMLVQCRWQGQLEAGNAASAMQARTPAQHR
jgi:hypothetical protein